MTLRKKQQKTKKMIKKMIKKPHKCKYCHKIMIEDLKKFLKSDKLPYATCPNCDCLTWRWELEVELK